MSSRLIAALLLAGGSSFYVSAQTAPPRPDAESSMAGGTPLLFRAYEVELALSAGPEHLRADASVYVFGKSGYERIKSGTNGFTCLVNRDGLQRGDPALRPTCWDAEGGATIVPVMLRVGELMAQGRSADAIRQDIDAGFDTGRFFTPRKAGIAYMLHGDVRIDPKTQQVSGQSFPPHYMIYAPGVSNGDIGIGEAASKDRFALPFVYSGYTGGTRTGYIIVLATEGKGHVH